MIVVFPRSWINPQEVENHHGKQIQGVIINHGCHGFAMPTQWMEWHSFPGIISKSKGSLVVVGQKNKHWMFSQIATFGSAAHIKHSGWTRIFVGCQGTCFDGPTSQKHWKGSWFLAGKPLLFTKSHRSFCEKNKRSIKNPYTNSRAPRKVSHAQVPPQESGFQNKAIAIGCFWHFGHAHAEIQHWTQRWRDQEKQQEMLLFMIDFLVLCCSAAICCYIYSVLCIYAFVCHCVSNKAESKVSGLNSCNTKTYPHVQTPTPAT